MHQQMNVWQFSESLLNILTKVRACLSGLSVVVAKFLTAWIRQQEV